jgi:hypothetical protein
MYAHALVRSLANNKTIKRHVKTARINAHSLLLIAITFTVATECSLTRSGCSLISDMKGAICGESGCGSRGT